MKRFQKVTRAAVCAILALVTLWLCAFSTFALDPSYNSLQDGATVENIIPINKASQIPTGTILAPSLWRDDLSENVRYLYNCLCRLPTLGTEDDRYYTDIEQLGIQYDGMTETSPVDDYSTTYRTFWYSRTLLDDGYQRDYYLEPNTGFWYDEIQVAISIELDGEVLPYGAVLPTTYTRPTEAQYDVTYNTLLFTREGEYSVTMMVMFFDNGDNPKNNGKLNTPYISQQTIKVTSVDSIAKDNYDRGYQEGYKIGFNNGVNSDEEFTIYGMINAVINAPVDFIEGALDFDVFGVNVASFVKMLFTLLIVAFVVIVILKVVL